MERLWVRLKQPIPGVDHMSAVDPVRFARLHGRWDTAAQAAGVHGVNDFYAHDDGTGTAPVRWHRASAGLKAVRAVLEYYRSGRGTLGDEERAAAVELFQAVEAVLDDADLRDIRFCFAGNY